MKLQPWFARWWVLWSVALGVLIGLGTEVDIWWHRVHLLLFVPVELWAYGRDGGGLGDTLSELYHYVGAWAGDSSRWYQSWNALVTLAACAVSYQVAYIFSWGPGPWDRLLPVGLVAGVGVALWLLYHFLNPSKHG